METALKYYGLIPEEVFQVTSVSTKKTTTFAAKVGNFSYRHVKPDLYWGYQLLNFNNQKILLAEPEKAILDYLYINSTLNTASAFLEMRLNLDHFKTSVDLDKLQRYVANFGNQQLAKRLQIFLTTIFHDSA